MVSLVALKRFPLSNRVIIKGEEFETDDKTAKVLLTMGNARRKESQDASEGKDTTLHVKRPYRRRDMTAEE